MSAVVAAGSMFGAWVNIQTTLATHTAEIAKNKGDIDRLDLARQEDKKEVKELVRDVKSDIRDVKETVVRVTERRRP